MKTSGRAVAAGVALASAVALASCTSGKGGANGGGESPGTGGGQPSVTVSIPSSSSVYRYDNAGLVVTIDFDKDTLTVDNGTGGALPPPGFYVLDARDGHRIDGAVRGAASVPEGRTVTFSIAPIDVELKNIGLVVLLMGADNYGAFVQQ